MDISVPTTLFFSENGSIPNNPNLPVVIYRNVFDELTAEKDKKFQHFFELAGWKGIWKNGLFDYHHFHSASHEALAIACGSTKVQLGGEDGQIVGLTAGDVVILPAGTGHKRLSASQNLVVMGAYPPGQENYDVCRECDAAKDIVAAINAVPLPVSDPIYGKDGALLTLWS